MICGEHRSQFCDSTTTENSGIYISNTSGHWRCLSSEELEGMSMSAWLGVSLSSLLDVDCGTGISTRESTGMILRVGRSGSSDIALISQSWDL